MSEDNTSEQYTRHTLEKVPKVARLYRSTATGIYHIRKSRSGRIFTRSLRTTSLATAKRVIDKALEELQKEIEAAFRVSFSNLPTGRSPRYTRMKYADGLEMSFGTRLSAGHKYSTTKNLSQLLKVLRDWTLDRWGDLTVDRILPEDIQALFKERMEAGMAPATRNTYLGCLRRVFRDMIDCDRRNGVKTYVPNPAEALKRLPVRNKVRIPETSVVLRVLTSIRTQNPFFADFLLAILYTGARLNEMSRVTAGDVDLQKRILHCPNSKAMVGRYGEDGYREVPLNQEAYDHFCKLLRVYRRKSGDLLFPDVVKETVRANIVRHCLVVGVPQFTCHQLRHIFATTCIESGVDIPTIARWLGHSDGGMLLLKTYGHLRSQHSHAMAAKVSFTHDRSDNRKTVVETGNSEASEA